MFAHSKFNQDINGWNILNVKKMFNMFDNDVYDKEITWDMNLKALFCDSYSKEITWDVDIKELFGDSYNDYLERRRLKVLKNLCIV